MLLANFMGVTMFRITYSKGFHITFENGWTISVQFGNGNYCNNKNLKNGDEVKCQNAEVAIWNDDLDIPMSEPEGWQSPSQVLAMMQEVASRSKVNASL